ncbi:MAG: LacI family DNA-binding transcriptional regulator [Nocardioides sp.]
MALQDTARRVTLRDVALLVGVSPSAVSMALSDHPRIGVETKDRVRAAARQLGYVANSAGRALRAQTSGSIALVVPNTGRHVFGHGYFMHLLGGVTDVSNAHDVHVIISTNPDEQHGVAAYERVLRSRAADCAIVTSAAVNDRHLNRLVESGLPVILLGRFPHLPDAVSVGIDDVAGAAAATDHLVESHGLRKLVHISGPMEHQSAIDRYEGFRQALTRHGLAHPQTLLTGDYSEESGRDAARQLLASSQEFDGVFAANDEMAYGAMTELRSAGLEVPRDAALIGYDDFGVSRITSPSISTVRVPAERMARLATERLFALMAGSAPEDRHLTLPVELVPRESCGCPRSDA